MIRVQLPYHLRTLAKVDGEVVLDGDLTTAAQVVAALEAAHPALRGTVRDPATGRRRPFVRYFACGEDVSHAPDDAPLPPPVVSGTEPFLVVGAMAGG